MFGLKIILTIIITLILVFTYLGTNPAVSGFFDSVGERFSSFSGDNTARGVEFSLAADKYSNIEFSGRNVNFTINGDTNAMLKTGNLQTNKTLGIYGFSGSGSVAGSTLVLDGRMSKVELPEITVAVQETIKSNSTFTSLSAVNLAVKEMKIQNTSGTLVVRGTSTQFSGDIDIISPAGDFGFGSKFTLAGKASKITLSNGISIV